MAQHPPLPTVPRGGRGRQGQWTRIRVAGFPGTPALGAIRETGLVGLYDRGRLVSVPPAAARR